MTIRRIRPISDTNSIGVKQSNLGKFRKQYKSERKNSLDSIFNIRSVQSKRNEIHSNSYIYERDLVLFLSHIPGSKLPKSTIKYQPEAYPARLYHLICTNGE